MEEWIQRETLAMVSELSELLDEVNFKWWKNKKPVSETRVKEELVDILHFFVSMCLDAGMDAEELHRMYLEKNKVNFDRQKGLWGKDYQAPARRRAGGVAAKAPGDKQKGGAWPKAKLPLPLRSLGPGAYGKGASMRPGAPRASLG